MQRMKFKLNKIKKKIPVQGPMLQIQIYKSFFQSKYIF